MDPTTIILDLPRQALSKAAVSEHGGRRNIYFEATREGVIDREGEEVTAKSLWDSRELMLDQGDFDISHWAHLPNQLTGRPQPEYRIGLPTQVTKTGTKGRQSIWVGGEIYSNLTAAPEGSSGDWAEKFWHSLTGQNPPAKWYPSVYGKIVPGGIEVAQVKGQTVRRITKVQWHSVGFALRAQHPTVGPVSLAPVGSLLAKADAGGLTGSLNARPDVLHLDSRTFAKAASEVGQIITDHAQLTGVQALTRQNLDTKTYNGGVSPAGSTNPRGLRARVVVLRAIKDGRLELNLKAISKAFRNLGASDTEAATHARKLLADIHARSQD